MAERKASSIKYGGKGCSFLLCILWFLQYTMLKKLFRKIDFHIVKEGKASSIILTGRSLLFFVLFIQWFRQYCIVIKLFRQVEFIVMEEGKASSNSHRGRNVLFFALYSFGTDKTLFFSFYAFLMCYKLQKL